MVKTFLSTQSHLSHNYKSCQSNDVENNMCFEVLGMDIILDHKLKPFLLEVNHAPSFNKDSPIDEYIKKNVLSDTFGILYKVGWRGKKY